MVLSQWSSGICSPAGIVGSNPSHALLYFGFFPFFFFFTFKFFYLTFPNFCNKKNDKFDCKLNICHDVLAYFVSNLDLRLWYWIPVRCFCVFFSKILVNLMDLIEYYELLFKIMLRHETDMCEGTSPRGYGLVFLFVKVKSGKRGKAKWAEWSFELPTSHMISWGFNHWGGNHLLIWTRFYIPLSNCFLL